jgi:hypothetical protein
LSEIRGYRCGNNGDSSFLEYGAVVIALLSIYVREKIDEVVFRLFHGQDGDSKLLRNFDTYDLIS